MNYTKHRNVVATILLWTLVIIGLVAAIYSIVNLFSLTPRSEVILTGIDSILFFIVALSAVLMLKWNRFGYYMFAVANIAYGIMHLLTMIGFIFTIFINLGLIVLIWGILQIPKSGRSSWSQMKMGLDYKHCRHIYQLFAILCSVSIVLTIVASLKHVTTDNDENIEIPTIDLVDTTNVVVDEPTESTEPTEQVEPSDTLKGTDGNQYSELSVEQLWRIVEVNNRDAEALYRLAMYYYKRNSKTNLNVAAFWNKTLVKEGDVNRYLPSNKREFSSVRFVFVMLARAYNNMSPSINSDIRTEVLRMLKMIQRENPGYRFE
jgi:hypothetical protein